MAIETGTGGIATGREVRAKLESRFLNQTQVMELLGVSHVKTFRDRTSRGGAWSDFPPPHSRTGRGVYWSRRRVVAWIERSTAEAAVD